MTKKEKSRPGDCSTRTAAETAACERAAVPYEDCTMSAVVRQIQIKDYLLHGAENAVPRRQLRQLTGLSDRDLRHRIQEERLAGVPILSDNTFGGYFLPANDQERRKFVQSMRSRAREIEAVATAVSRGNGGLNEQTPYTVPEETL